MEKIVCLLLPEKKTGNKQEEFHLEYIKANLVQTPKISVLQAQKETARFAQYVQQMFAGIMEMFDLTDAKAITKHYEKITHQEEITDQMEMEIARYLEQVSNDHLSDDTKGKVRQMLREISELESIGDSCHKLARTLSHHPDLNQVLPQNVLATLRSMMQLTGTALTHMNTIMTSQLSRRGINEAYRIENDINQMRNTLKKENIRSVDDHQYPYAVGTVYSDLINECENLGDYVVNVVQARYGV